MGVLKPIKEQRSIQLYEEGSGRGGGVVVRKRGKARKIELEKFGKPESGTKLGKISGIDRVDVMNRETGRKYCLCSSGGIALFSRTLDTAAPSSVLVYERRPR